MPDLTHLARALAVRAVTRDEGQQGGLQAVTRSDALIGTYDDHPATGGAQMIYDEMMALTIADMPPSTDLVSTLLETIAMREGGISRANAWQVVGIKPTRGKDLLARNSGAVDWPIWYTLREAALGDAPP